MSYFNGSKDGYEAGFSDGENGRGRNPIPLSSALKHALHPENYTETFLNGYAQGWVDGNKKRKDVANSKNN